MKTIAIGKTPPKLIEARARGESYKELDSADSGVREALFAEQNGLCAYCERTLVLRREGKTLNHKTQIEHYHPRNPDPKTPWTSDCTRSSGARSQTPANLTWKNLLLVCPKSAPTCDTPKDNIDICSDFINPKGAPYATLLECASTGVVRPLGFLPPTAGEVIEKVLCLNHPSLVEARRLRYLALVDRVAKDLQRCRSPRPARRKALAEHLRREADGVEFPTVYLSYAECLER